MRERRLAYSVVDVFAERALEGNPLAIFHDARSLSDAEMQRLARETNLSETTFVLPEDDEREGVRVRIFTAQEELPFAGHPTLGTASWLYWHHPTLRGAREITLRENAGPIRVQFEAHARTEPGVRGRMAQADPVFGMTHEPAAVAAALGLAAEDLDAGHAPQTVSTGVPFCAVLLRSMEAIGRLAMSQRVAEQYLAGTDAKWFYCIAPAHTRLADAGPHWHARMQFGGGEDPATGSAAGCCIAWLVRHGLAASRAPVVIKQGVEISRPSRIEVQATLEDGQVGGVLVGGRTIPVAAGEFFLP